MKTFENWRLEWHSKEQSGHDSIRVAGNKEFLLGDKSDMEKLIKIRNDEVFALIIERNTAQTALAGLEYAIRSNQSTPQPEQELKTEYEITWASVAMAFAKVFGFFAAIALLVLALHAENLIRAYHGEAQSVIQSK